VACGLATLREIQRPGFYQQLSERTARLVSGLMQMAHSSAPGLAFSGDSVGGMFGLYFAAEPPNSYAQVMATDKERFNRFFHAMLDRGVYLAPSAFEAGFVSMAHDDRVIDTTVSTAREAFTAIAGIEAR
jgi:glutamate-1-semialdehyde 2,1-aminomutase